MPWTKLIFVVFTIYSSWVWALFELFALVLDFPRKPEVSVRAPVLRILDENRRSEGH